MRHRLARNLLVVLLALWACAAPAQDKSFRLNAPATLVDSGLLRHILPRFSLKTGIRITLIEGPADAAFGVDGTPVFRDETTIWHFDATPGAHTDAFRDWLLSDVGQRTISGFQPEGVALFSTDLDIAKVEAAPEPTGNTALGEKVSLVQCGRCHVINDSNRMNAIGSSPSFALMRSFEDWQRRFETFFLLKPHPAFTQVEEVTEPFAEHLPSPIAPIEVTLEEIEAIVAYVGTITPADLGAPIQFQ